MLFFMLLNTFNAFNKPGQKKAKHKKPTQKEAHIEKYKFY